MKTILTFASILVIIFNSFAQSKIAVQNGGTPKFYTELTDAVTNAVSGDTIYIPGGTFTAGFTLTKKLHLVGVGHNIDSTLVTGITKFISNVTLSAGSDNSSMEGIYLDGDLNFGETTTPTVVSGFFMRRCNVNKIYFVTSDPDTQIRYANNLFIESVIRSGIVSSTIGYYNSMQVQSNSFFNNIINWDIGFLGNNCMFKNNILILDYFRNVKGAVFENNYIGKQVISSEIFSCTFYNNINQNLMSTLSHELSNLFRNNIDNQALTDTFVNYTAGVAYSYDFDYHLKATSPGKNAGIDGTDIGIYGGTFPWKEGSVPSYPHFQSATIAPQTDNTGKLNVKLKVAAQDN